MNKFVTAVKTLDVNAVKTLLMADTKWHSWQEADGKNALHYLGGVITGGDLIKQKLALDIAQELIEQGVSINSVHLIKDGCDNFPATPLWYAYTRGRNKTLYNWLLQNGTDPNHCMFAIAWYNDVEAAALFKNYGANIEEKTGRETPFLSAFNWKRYDIAEWLLQNGADVNAVGTDGNTALHYAVRRKINPVYIKMLLKYHADPLRENDLGLSPQKMAEQNRQRNILSIFNKKTNQ